MPYLRFAIELVAEVDDVNKVLIMLTVCGVAGAAVGSTITLDGVAAYVNGVVVTEGEVREALGPQIPQLRQVYEGAELSAKIKEAHDEARDELINAKLILKAYDADTKMNKDGVEKYVEKKYGEFVDDRFGGDRQEFLKALRDEHLSMEEWRRRMRERIIVGMMKSREVDSKVSVSPRDVRHVYEDNPKKYFREERVSIRVILLRGAAGVEKAREAMAKLAAGTDFADLAKSVSEDAKASVGGDWGWVDMRDLRPELAKPVAALKKGAISDLIRMDGDSYVVKLEDHLAAGPVPFEEVRVSIERELRRKEIRRLTVMWMERLRKDAYIRVVEASGN